MARINRGNCGCEGITPCGSTICTSPTDPTCETFTLNSSNTDSPTGVSDVTDVTLNVKRVSAFKDHLEFVNSPVGMSSIIGHTVLRLSNKFLSGVTNLFRGRNVGTGAKLYKGLKVEGADTFQDFRTLKSSESITVSEGIDEVTSVVNETWLAEQFPTIPSVDYPVIESEDIGTGTSLRKDVTAKKIGIRTLTSDDFIIAEQLNGSVKISSPGGGSTSSDWFLDANFVRPANWNTAKNPKEQISGQPVANGTLNDPFKTYEEYLLKRIYGSGGTGTGTPSKFNPKYPTKTLQILSSLSTASDLEVVNTTLYLRNFITLTYTGIRNYALDYSTIFDALTGAGNLPFTINNTIKGEGIITSVNNFGLVYHKSNSTKTANGNFCLLNIEAEGRGLFFVEGNSVITYTPLTKNGGGDLKYGQTTVQGINQSPTIPLIVVEGTNSGYWNAIITGTKFFIQTNTQIGIRYFNEGKITSSADKVTYQVGNNRIGYETRLDATTPVGVNLDIVNFYENPSNGNGKIYYKPYDSYVMFRGEDTGTMRIENLTTEANGFSNAGINSIISLSGTASFENVSMTNDVGGAPALNFLKVQGSTTKQNFNNANINSKYFNFVKGDTSNTINLVFENSKISPENIQQDVSLLNIYTKGTLSTIKSKPIISIDDIYADATLASAAGLIKGTLFKTSAGDVQQVNI